jgi:hypothetical protein
VVKKRSSLSSLFHLEFLLSAHRTYTFTVLFKEVFETRNHETRDWTKLHNEEGNCIFITSDCTGIIKSRIGVVGHVECMGKMLYTNLIGNPEWDGQLERSLLSFSMALPAHSGPTPLIQFSNHFSQPVGLLGWVISPSQGLYLHTEQHKCRINKYTKHPCLEWHSNPASERAKTVHDLDRAVTVSGLREIYYVSVFTRVILKWIVEKQYVAMWTGFIWMEASDRLLWAL